MIDFKVWIDVKSFLVIMRFWFAMKLSLLSDNGAHQFNSIQLQSNAP